MQNTQIIEISPTEYRKAEGINFTSLSALAVSPKHYQDMLLKEPVDTDAFIRGGAVDCLLTTPEEFKNEFYVMTAKKPESVMMVAYVEKYLETEDHGAALQASGYKRPLPTAKWEEEGKPYYEALKASNGKRILSFDTYSKVQSVVNSFQTSEYTQKYFNERNNCDLLFQKAIFWKTKGLTCKSLLDLIIIDHNKKSIIPIDIKTTGNSVYSFPASFKKWKYYLQAAFYTAAVNYWINSDPILKEYTVQPFKFLVAEMDNYNLPIVYKVSTDDLYVGTYGGEDRFGNQIRGWKQLIDELHYHSEKSNWNYPEQLIKNNGEVELNAFIAPSVITRENTNTY